MDEVESTDVVPTQDPPMENFDVGLVGVPSEVDTSQQDISGDFSRSFSIIGMEYRSLLLRSFRERKPISG
ncbi:unnamed protein product [Prunus armeniaca]